VTRLFPLLLYAYATWVGSDGREGYTAATCEVRIAQPGFVCGQITAATPMPRLRRFWYPTSPGVWETAVGTPDGHDAVIYNGERIELREDSRAK
jgi:hypothetical protein